MNTHTTAETPKADLRQLKIEPRALSELKPFSGNARTHSKKQITQIAAAIRQFGFNNPVLIDQTTASSRATAGSRQPNFSSCRACRPSGWRI